MTKPKLSLIILTCISILAVLGVLYLLIFDKKENPTQADMNWGIYKYDTSPSSDDNAIYSNPLSAIAPIDLSGGADVTIQSEIFTLYFKAEERSLVLKNPVYKKEIMSEKMIQEFTGATAFDLSQFKEHTRFILCNAAGNIENFQYSLQDSDEKITYQIILYQFDSTLWISICHDTTYTPLSIKHICKLKPKT